MPVRLYSDQRFPFYRRTAALHHCDRIPLKKASTSRVFFSPPHVGTANPIRAPHLHH